MNECSQDQGEDEQYLEWLVELVFIFYKNKLRENRTPVPKALGVDDYNILYFIIRITLSLTEEICWLIY
jgi:hypothetical protein